MGYRCPYDKGDVMKKTTFFGPFVGEFGWEIAYWHAWVNKMCLTKFRDYHKIVCSHPGHQLFYPHADEYIPLPKAIQNLPARSYITDSWMGGYPKPHAEVDNKNIYLTVRAETMKLHQKLPRDAICHYPWSFSDGEDNYGVRWSSDEITSDDEFVTTRVPLDKQVFEKIKPTKESIKLLAEKVDLTQDLITIFPRRRKTRRPDKNWPKESYLKLIQELQQRNPRLKVALIGTPNGAYFADGVPEGCVDLINVDDNHRMDYEVAALDHSVLTVGSISGAILFSLICGCPSLTWGYGEHTRNLLKKRTH